MLRTLDSLSSIGMMGRMGPKRYRPIAQRLNRMNEAFFAGITSSKPEWTSQRWAEAREVAISIYDASKNH